MLSFLSQPVTVKFAHMCERQVPALRLRTERVDFLFFLIMGLRKRSEFYELSEEEGEDGPKMCGFSTISGIPR
jgi:hypothetical protein